MMSFHELSRRELQSRCKEYGLPANKSNAAMATSLTTFLGDPRTNVLVRAPQVIWAKKCVKARVLQPVNSDTSLASFILEASESRTNALKSKPLEVRKVPDLCVDSVPQPKTAPLLRRKKNTVDVAHHSTDSSSNRSPLHGEILMQENGIVLTMISSASEPQLAPILDAETVTCDEDPIESEAIASPSEAVLHDQGCHENKRCCEVLVQPALRPLVFRISGKVDNLITKASRILKTFEEWKAMEGSDTLPTALETH